MNGKKLSVAIDLYDRHLPLFTGAVSSSIGLEFDFLEVGMVPPRRNGINRHKRMLIDKEFDIAEISLASYIVSRDLGDDDITALPIYPRRLYSQNHIFVSDKSGINNPSDLVGRCVVIWAFQVTMSVLAKGDLKRDYGVDWKDIHWLTESPEEIRMSYGDDIKIDLLPADFDVEKALRDGEVDAYINPHPPEDFMRPGDGISRLFPDWQNATGQYFAKHNYFPIMHVLGVKTELLKHHPGLADDLVRMFNEARIQARSFYTDPNYSMLMHSRNLLEYESVNYGSDVWSPDVEIDRQNLSDFIGFCVDQRLIKTAPRIEDIFYTP